MSVKSPPVWAKSARVIFSWSSFGLQGAEQANVDPNTEGPWDLFGGPRVGGLGTHFFGCVGPGGQGGHY